MTSIAFRLALVGVVALAFLFPVTSPAGADQVSGERGSRILAISRPRTFADWEGLQLKRRALQRDAEGVTGRNGSQAVDLAAGYKWSGRRVITNVGLSPARSAEVNILAVQLRRDTTGPRGDSYSAGYKWGSHRG